MKKKILAIVLAGSMIFQSSAGLPGVLVPVEASVTVEVPQSEEGMSNAEKAENPAEPTDLGIEEANVNDSKDAISETQPEEPLTAEQNKTALLENSQGVSEQETANVSDVGTAKDEIAAEEENIAVAAENSTDNGEVIADGVCGDNLTWILTSDGVLTISGTGEMEGWNASYSVPWFSHRSNIKKVIMKEGVTSIHFCAFRGCSVLTEVSIPNSVTYIGDEAFGYCHSLKSVTIPNSVTKLDREVFTNCKNLEEVFIGSGVKDLNAYMFSDCPTLRKISVDNGNISYISQDGIIYSKDRTQLFLVPAGYSEKELLVPDTVTLVCSNALYQNRNIRSICFQDGLKTMENSAAKGCLSLKKIFFCGEVPVWGDDKIENVLDIEDLSIYCSLADAGWGDLSNNADYSDIGWHDISSYIGVTELSICENETILSVGGSLQLTTLIDPKLAMEFVWTSSDSSVASVTANGKVLGWKEGQVVISVNSQNKVFSGEITITVTSSSRVVPSNPECILKGQISDNISDNDYLKWNSAIKSYITEESDGSLNRIEYISEKGILVENYSQEYELTGSRVLDIELPLFGGFFSGENANFLVFGQKNLEESNDCEVMRIVKYSKEWERINAVSVYGAYTYIPFEAGTLRMVEADGKLYIHTCHKMYAFDDGLNHQANMTYVLNEETMEMKEASNYFWGIDDGNVGHSFNQFICTDGQYVYRVDHGDGNPRAVCITRCAVNNSITKVSYTYALEILGTIGDNYTGVSVGGLDLSSDNCLVVGNSVDQSNPSNYSAYGQRNIFLTVTGKKLGNTKTVWLTDYTSEDKITPRTPQLVKLSDDQFLVLWEESNGNNGKVKTRMVTVDGDGTIVSSIISADFRLSDCQPIVTSDGIVTWYVTDGKQLILYRINPYRFVLHKYDEGKVLEEVTCVKDGTIVYTCSVCGDIYTKKVGAMGHDYFQGPFRLKWDYKNLICTVEYVCRCGDKVSRKYNIKCSYREAPTCTEAGYCIYSFKDELIGCTYQHRVSEQALGHAEGEQIKENNVEATCEKEGSYETAVYCTRCKEELSREKTMVKALGHSYDEGKITKEATCTADGVRTYTCATCRESYTEAIKATGHKAGSPVREKIVEATCTKDGSYQTAVYCTMCKAELSREDTTVEALGHVEGKSVKENIVEATCKKEGSYETAVYCTRCKEELSREKITVKALGHSYDEGKITKEATCTEDGIKTYTCATCKGTYTEVIKATGHKEGKPIKENIVEATCTKEGFYQTAIYCTECKAELSRENTIVEALGHVEGEPIKENNVEATCEKEGSYETAVYCTRCKMELSREKTTVKALGHSYDEGEITKEATCTEDGIRTYTCGTCGGTYTEAIRATGHKEGTPVTENVVEATCTKKGSYQTAVYCTKCKAELSREDTIVEALGHVEGKPAKENIVEATCEKEGSYETAVYCTRCKEELNREKTTVKALGHSYDEGKITKEATCIEDGIRTYTCGTCGGTYTEPIKAIGHKEGTPVTENIVEATCTENGSYQTVVYCTKCKAELSRENTIVKELGHVEGKPVKENIIEATCEKEGSYETAVYCTRCKEELNREKTTVKALGHSYDEGKITKEATCIEDGIRTYTCGTCGGTYTEPIKAIGHKEGTPVTENIVEATCTENGAYQTVVYCTKCKAELSREDTIVEALGHVEGKSVKENIVEATCEKDGSYETAVYCTRCKEELNREKTTVKALGHSYDEGKITKEASCTEDGVQTYTCATCGETYTEVIKATGHKGGTPVKENIVEATCTEDGSYQTVIYCTECNAELSREDSIVEALGHVEGKPVKENIVKATCEKEGSYETTVYCTRCKEELSREKTTVKAFGHSYDEGKIAKEATCTEDGIRTYTCETCGETYTEAIKATGHKEGTPITENIVEATCTKEGSYQTVVYCTKCKAELSRENAIVEALGHVEGNPVIENNMKATCEKEGSYEIVIYCTRCKAELSREKITVEALGHSFDEGKVTKEATCTESGIRTYTCATCGETYTEAIKATGHKEGIPVTENVVEATCTKEGSYETAVYCTRCKTELSREKITIPATGDEKPTPTPTEKPTPTPTEKPTPGATDHKSHIGKTFIVNGLKYKVTKDDNTGREVRVTSMKEKRPTLKIPARVTQPDWNETFLVTSVKAKAFKKTAITKAVIGKNVRKIGPNAFLNCKKLKRVTIGNSVKNIGIRAFYGCSSLVKVNIKTKALKTVKKNAFKRISKKAIIKTPKGKKNAYTRYLKGKIAKGVKIR